MKKLLTILLCAFAPLLPTPAADVVFNLADFTTSVITNRQVKMEPKSTPRRGPSDSVISRDSLFRYSDTNGTFTVTNMVYGTYLCTLMGPYAKTEFRIYVDDTNATLNASELLVSANDNGIDTEDGIPIDLE
jgi:hypothetical protein